MPIEASPDFPTFRTFTKRVLKECPEYNYGYDDVHKIGEPKGLGTIVTPEQFEQLAHTFISNQIDKDTPDTKLFLLQKQLQNESILSFIGDIHGSIHSLIRIIWSLIGRDEIDENLHIINPRFKLVFLGDYIDSGRYNLLTLALLLKLTNDNPDNVFLICGNHEDVFKKTKWLPSTLTIETEKTRNGDMIQLYCEMIFNHLPIMIFFTDEKKGHIRCCHGGGLLDASAESRINEWLMRGTSTLLLSDLAINKKHYQFLQYRILWGDFKADNTDIEIKERGSQTKSITYSEAQEMITIAQQNEIVKLNLLAIFRGHQDFDSDMKFLVPETIGSTDGLLKTPPDLKTFRIKDYGYLPIFTLTTASEGKSLPISSCIILDTTPPYEEWVAQRIITTLGNGQEQADQLHPHKLRYYLDFSDNKREKKIEALYSMLVVNFDHKDNPIKIRWFHFPFLMPLIFKKKQTARSPAPELTPGPTE